MAGYLLDSNIISALMRAPQGRIAQRVARAGEANVFTSVIVAAELRFGALKKGSRNLAHEVQEMFRRLEVKSLEPPADAHYARLRTELERAGTPISANDMLIAAHALALDATLVTDNEKEFSRVAGLQFENWLR
ncbi:MAG: type II toxin-antitoxin system VapC family toxin [Caulobacterales bacterium]